MTPNGYASRSLCLTLTLVPNPHGQLSTTIRQFLVELRPVARPQELSCCLKTDISLSNSAIGSLHPSPYTLGYIFKSSVFRCLTYLCVLCLSVCVPVYFCLSMCMCVCLSNCLKTIIHHNASRSYPSNPFKFQCSCSTAVRQELCPKLVPLPFDCTELTSLCHSWPSP